MFEGYHFFDIYGVPFFNIFAVSKSIYWVVVRKRFAPTAVARFMSEGYGKLYPILMTSVLKFRFKFDAINSIKFSTKFSTCTVCVCVCVYRRWSLCNVLHRTRILVLASKFRKYKYHNEFIIVHSTANTSNLCQLYTRPDYSSSKTKAASGPGQIWKSDGVFLIFISS